MKEFSLLAKRDFFSVFSKAPLFFRQVFQEGRRIIWPTRRDVVTSSIIVFVLSAIFAVFFFIVDQALMHTVQWILGVSARG